MLVISGKHKLNESAIDSDKSLTIRALIFGALSGGKCTICNALICADTLATISCLQALGTQIDVSGNNVTVIPPKLFNNNVVLDCKNSGTTARLLAGMLCGLGITATVTGDKSLLSRPMERVLAPLREMGAKFEIGSGFLYKTCGGVLLGKNFTQSVVSAQVKSAIIIAGLFAEGTTTYTESMLTRTHTENMLSAFGADVVTNGNTIVVNKSQIKPFDITIPKDFSSAFNLVALAVAEKQNFTIHDVGVNKSRTTAIDILNNAGAKIEINNIRQSFGEDIGDIVVSPSNLGNIVANGEQTAIAIDELLTLSVVALATKGKHMFCGVKELAVKESDRLQAIIRFANSVGQKANFDGTNLTIESNGALPKFVSTTTDGDHRTAFAGALLAIICGGGAIDDDCFDISFPHFLRAIGIAPKQYAVIGSKVQNSLSPKLMQQLASGYNQSAVNKIDFSYKAITLGEDVTDGELLSVINSLDGANITMPFKERIAKLTSAKLSAVNTIGKYIEPTSTDGYGIICSLHAHNIDISNKSLWLIGAGGASKTACEELTKYTKKIKVINRTKSKALALESQFDLSGDDEPFGILSFVPECDFEKQVELPQSARFVLCANYMGENGLANKAKAKGIEVISGLEMLYYQGAKSFSLWTNSLVQEDCKKFLEMIQ